MRLKNYLAEDITVPIKVGDIVLGGKFKNKKIKVKKIGKNEKGDITINGKAMMRFRIIPQIKESTYTQGYGDETMAQDDDYPTGNILMGDKYIKSPYYNKLTSFDVNWAPDAGKWDWTDFEACGGMGSKQSYNDTLKDNNTAISKDRIFAHMTNKEPVPIPKNLRALGNEVLPNTDAWGTEKTTGETDQNKVDTDTEPEEKTIFGKNKEILLTNKILKKLNDYLRKNNET